MHIRQLRGWLMRLFSIFNRAQREREFAEELESHLAFHMEDNLRAGMSPEEARRQALVKLGGVTLTQERYREQGGLPMLETLLQDLRFGLRMMLKHKGFTAVAVLSLALGIGANTAIFSLIDAVLLKMLPVERPEQLYFIQNVGTRRQDGGAPPYPCFERFRDHNQSFTGMAAFTGLNQRVRIDGRLEEVSGQTVSGNYFSLLGINAVLGRMFGPADDAVPGRGGPDGVVAVISYNYWTNRFGRDPGVIGKVVQLGNNPVTIIGVTPPHFYGLVPGSDPNLWLPMMTAGAESLASKETWWLDTVGRVKPGVPIEQARAELDSIFQSYMDETSMNAEARREAFNRIDLRPASRGLNGLRRQFSQPLQALMAIVALVLLIACANVANLLLARATARRKEFAVRLALGASRLRLMRQVLTESLLLVSLGGLLGLLFARWGSAFLASFFATGRGRLFVNLPLDYRVLSFTAAVALLTGLIFGLAPALQATRVEPNSALKDSAGTSTRARSRFGKALVVAQVALSLLLLIGAGLFVRTLHNLKTIDAGFRPEGVMTMLINPPDGAYQGERLNGLWKDVLARVERLPGVRSASLTTLSPLSHRDRGVAIDVAGFSPSSDRDRGIRMNQVSPGYFQTFSVPIGQGRSFTDADNETAPKVAMFNEAAARFYFGDHSPLGAQVRFGRREQASAPYEIVGVVKDARNRNLREADTKLIYLPFTQARDRLERLTLAVRADDRPTELTSAIGNELRAIGPDIMLTNIVTLNEQIDQSLLLERLVATLSLFFGLLALLLVCIGLYGVMAYDVARRTHELGIRLALGATARDVLQLIIGQGMRMVTLGLGLGIVVALLVSRWLTSLLFGVTATDPLTFGVIVLLLLIVALLACWLPARRASKVDPLIALRHD